MKRLATVGAIVCLAAACGGEAARFEPFVDVPPEGTEGYPYGALDQLTLSLAHAGSDGELGAVTVVPGDALTLPDVPRSDDLVVHLSGSLLGEEVAYGRTCAISLAPTAPVPSPHLFFSNIVTWSPSAAPAVPVRTTADALPLADGGLLLVGGANVVERFDAIAGEFVGLAGALARRDGATLSALPGDRALVVGGRDASNEPVARLEVLAPGAGPAQQVQVQEGAPRLWEHAAATLPSGEVLVFGGNYVDGPGIPASVTTRAWKFTLGAGGVIADPAGSPSVGALARARAGHTATRIDDEIGIVLVAGGQDATGMPVGSAELYLPSGDVFEEVEGATMIVPRFSHQAVRLRGGFVLIVGGYTRATPGDAAVPVAEVEVYDPFRRQFRLAGTVEEISGLGWNDASVTALPDGRALIAGGRDATGAVVPTTAVADLRLLGETLELRLLRTADLSAPRANHAAAALCDGTVLVVGGTDDAGAPPSERYNPPSAFRR